MTQTSTTLRERTVSKFHRNPTGLTVALHDGREVEILGYVDTPKRGRWLRVKRGHWGWPWQWVHVEDVASVVVFSLSLQSDAKPSGLRQALGG